MLTRRKMLSFAPILLAAPAIVRVSSLMPVKVWSSDVPMTATEVLWRREEYARYWANIGNPYGVSPAEIIIRDLRSLRASLAALEA